MLTGNYVLLCYQLSALSALLSLGQQMLHGE
jgi:hypothetical protein